MKTDPPPVIGPYRYAKGCVVVRCPSGDGFKTRAARLAEHLRGCWVHRAGGYVMPTTKAAKLLELFAAGRDASSITRELYLVNPTTGA